jgi:hypothetical protein
MNHPTGNICCEGCYRIGKKDAIEVIKDAMKRIQDIIDNADYYTDQEGKEVETNIYFWDGVHSFYKTLLEEISRSEK